MITRYTSLGSSGPVQQLLPIYLLLYVTTEAAPFRLLDMGVWDSFRTSEGCLLFWDHSATGLSDFLDHIVHAVTAGIISVHPESRLKETQQSIAGCGSLTTLRALLGQ